ncbi:MAG: hypothetical protein U0W40_16770 [Acidimicrobiia bacterium]
MLRKMITAGAAVAVAVALSGCSGGGDDSSAKSTTTTTVASTTTTAGSSGSSGGSGSSGSNSGGSSSGGSTQGPAPVITSFTTPENIDCHNGNSQTFSASWTTTNAVKTTISIDGAGVYKTYGANDSDSLPFNCTSSHTFLLTAYGSDGRTVTRSITLQPRNAQTTTTDSSTSTTSGATTTT